MQNLILSSLFILCFLQNLSLIQAQDILIVCHDPSTSSNYTSGSQFETNLKTHLIPSLISNGSLNNGFFNTSSGNNPDSGFGLAQCRGDVSMNDCRSCLNTSSVLIYQKCPNRKNVTIRLDYCLLRFSSSNFFSIVDSGYRKWIGNNQNVSGDQIVYNGLLGEFMNNLSSRAMEKPSKFETGSVRYNDFSNIYGLVQCTQDLSSGGCLNCLQVMISTIPRCCSGKVGGQVLSKSCFIRFEAYKFFELLPPPAPPPNFPPPPTVEGSSPPPADVTGEG